MNTERVARLEEWLNDKLDMVEFWKKQREMADDEVRYNLKKAEEVQKMIDEEKRKK